MSEPGGGPVGNAPVRGGVVTPPGDHPGRPARPDGAGPEAGAGDRPDLDGRDGGRPGPRPADPGRARAGQDDQQADAPSAPGSEEFRERDRTIRKEQAASRQSLSGSAHGVQASAGSQASMHGHAIRDINAHYVTIGGAGQEVTARTGPLSRAWLRRLRTVFVETGAYRELARRLPDRRVQVLHGAAGSGRITTAVIALAHVVGEPVPHGEDDDEDARVEALSRDTEPGQVREAELQAGRAYLLDRSAVSEPDWLDLATLTRLRKVVADRKAFLVVVVDDRAKLDRANLGESLVRQDRPDPDQVLDAHLDDLEGGATVPWTDALKREVQQELKAAPAPGRVAELASYLAAAAQAGTSGDDIIKGLARNLLARAVEKLARPLGNAEPDAEAKNADKSATVETVEALRRRALLLACSVLDGLPLVTVTDAATDLVKRLYERETPDEPLPLPVFGSAIEVLLEYAEATDQPPTQDAADEVTRRVWMRPGLPAAVLEAAWRHYDTVRDPLVDWLRMLANSGDETLQVRAAYAMGKLACYDHEYICDSVIERWAASPNPALRWAAAWALEMVVTTDERLAPLVGDRVWRWCNRPSQRRQQGYNRQRTALLAYTTAIATQNVATALESLSRLAERPGQGHDYAVALGLRKLFHAGYHAECRETLAEWAEVGRRFRFRPLTVQAARGLLFIGQDVAEPADGRPDILELFAHDPAWHATADELWELALTDAATTRDGWDVMWLWLRRAGRESAFEEPVTGLVTRLARIPGLRHRFRFYQRFWPEDQDRKDPDVERVLARALRQGKDHRARRDTA